MSKLFAMILIALVCSCAATPPRPTTCRIISERSGAVCTPADPRDEVFDADISELLGYACYSPDDIADIRAFIRSVLKRFDEVTK